MAYLITGGAGFIGSFLARALIKLGYDIIVIDNFQDYYSRKAKEFNLDLIRLTANQNPENFDLGIVKPIHSKLNELSVYHYSAEKLGNFKFFECDIRDYNQLEKIFKNENIEKVTHLAAMAGVPYSLKNPLLYSDVNLNGTVNLLQLSAEHNIKSFVFGSSSSIYGGRANVPFLETDNVSKPISPYAATKRMGEIICYTYHYLYKIPITIARIFGPIYGPLQRPYGMAAQRFIRQIDRNKPVTIYGDGTMGRDSTYIDDGVDGLIKCLNKNFDFETINIGTGKPVTVIELANHVKSLFGKGELIYLEKPLTEVPITFASVSKAKELLGYSPKVEFADGIKKQFEIFNLMPQWYKNLEG